VARTIADARARRRLVVTGSIRGVRVQRDTVLQFDADLDDGTGRIMLVFLGRAAIGGIEPGRRVTIEGTVTASHGHHVVLNPLYQLEPES
jgi:predicted extracellular nuclease